MTQLFCFCCNRDPDHEPITDVLSRLGDYTHTYKPEISLANTDCECKSHDERVSSRLAKVYDSDCGESSDSEDEGTVKLKNGLTSDSANISSIVNLPKMYMQV